MVHRSSPALSAAVVLTLLTSAAASAAAQHASQPAGSTLSSLVSTSYDSTSDTTRVRTAVVPVRGALKMYAGYRFAGASPSSAEPPAAVFLVFQEASAAPSWESPYGRTLELWIDDKDKVVVERTEYLRRAEYERGPVTMDVTEWVWATLPTETFARIAGAKKVEGRLGTRSFALGTQQLRTLRELASSLPPTAAAAAGSVVP